MNLTTPRRDVHQLSGNSGFAQAEAQTIQRFEREDSFFAFRVPEASQWGEGMGENERRRSQKGWSLALGVSRRR